MRYSFICHPLIFVKGASLLNLYLTTIWEPASPASILSSVFGFGFEKMCFESHFWEKCCLRLKFQGKIEVESFCYLKSTFFLF